MYSKYGIRLVIKFFLEVHLFDLLNGTDTHKWLQITDYENISFEKLQHSVNYQASFTSEIRYIYDFILKNFEHENLTIIDVGCGKGKVVYYLSKKFHKLKSNHKIIGVELNKSLSDIANRNVARLKHEPKPQIFNCDAIDFNLSASKGSVLVLLYNPFDKFILDNFIKKNKNIIKYIFYTNPIHHEVLLSNSFIVKKTKKSWHPNLNTTIFLNSLES